MQEDIFLLNLQNKTEFSSVLGNISQNKSPLLINGLLSSQRAHIAHYLSANLEKKLVLVTSNEIEAERIYTDLEFYNPDRVLFIKNEETRFYAIEAKDRKEESKRIESLIRLAKEDYDILVLSVETLMRKYLPKRLYVESKLDLEIGSIWNLSELVDLLVHYGYEREARVEGPGQISLRGGILDIYLPTAELPYRLEFFDDEIDSIRTFDPISQKSIDKIKQITISPAREFLFREGFEEAAKRLSDDLSKSSNDDLAFDIERISEGHYFEGMHKYIDYIYPDERKDLFSYINKEAIFVIHEPNRVLEKGENYFEEFSEDYKHALEKGFALKGQGELLYNLDYVTEYMGSHFIVLQSFLPKSVKGFNTASIVNFETREPVSFQGKIPALLEEIKYQKKQGYTIVLVERDEDTIMSLYKELSNASLEPIYLRDRKAEIPEGKVVLVKGRLTEGYVYSKSKLAVISDKEMFGVTKKSSKQKIKHKGKKIESFIDLKAGDHVVHETYGVGKFVGIESKKFDDIRKDYIKIVYSAGDALYVPLSQMDKVQKYIGTGAGDAVKLNKLGTSEWKKTKAKAKKAVDEIAQDLIDLYAERRDARGYAFTEDTPWQKEFESLFPYEETVDQINAIEDVKKDMQNIKPMDRLICGDVGYGKTEVAIRAIFKACMDSKQVAFLVPTTILAQQHYNNLKERFAGYPIRVEVVSRFKTKKAQEQIIDDARRGLVDVLIGTHRILSKDVSFKDLGLLVVDEEQRFGVKHKELLKKLKKDVDVLTLSATPIPRTLHFSLSGIRDMSLLEEPPEDRHPIMTYVTEAREGIILDALERELARGGQVFFVYNRVQTIDKMADIIRRLVPDANLAVAHGQMSPRQLENIMVDFLEKEYDILLSTTIIETGMDISNANTMIVYDADKMGLSQLYQLRGRVGRSSRQAYAYFMYQKDKVLTEVSEKRLKAIKEFTEFGSGFKIAMRDLEIRGAGNILGERQHGHMTEIGYDLYVKMLDAAIRNLQGQVVEQKVDTEIELDINAYIPENYIDDEMSKIEIYKKIASIESKQDLYEIEEEVEDRFSNIPEPVRNLMHIAYIKALGEKLGILKIKQNKTVISFIGPTPESSVKKDFKEKESYKLITNISSFLEMML